MPELLRVRNLSSSWGGTPVLHDVSFDLGEGELLALLGPNGSGKTTLLRLIAGLDLPTSGEVWLGAGRLDGVPAHLRGVGLLFQEPLLFPSRTVWENIAYGPQVQRRPAALVEATVDELLKLLRLEPLSERYPHQLSGGERQRTALARTLAPAPAVVLLDEPFASVDPALRRELRAEFRRVLAARRTAAILVTHDREEGMFLGDRVAVLLEGRLRQTGAPAAVFEHPSDRSVAAFLGYDLVEHDGWWWAVDPSELQPVDEADGRVRGEVVAAGWSPQGTVLIVRGPDGQTWEVRRSPRSSRLRPGDRVGLTWDRGRQLERSLERDQGHMV